MDAESLVSLVEALSGAESEVAWMLSHRLHGC